MALSTIILLNSVGFIFALMQHLWSNNFVKASPMICTVKNHPEFFQAIIESLEGLMSKITDLPVNESSSMTIIGFKNPELFCFFLENAKIHQLP